MDYTRVRQSALVVVGLLCCATVQAQDVFISEFHYDNAGSDSGEFVEVAGVAGTDLSGYSLLLYNGNGGGLYDTVALSGVIDDEGAGSGALAFFVTGIQNGSPDGLALTDPTGALVEFLSYEGVFMATDGPLAGLASTDVGVSEPGDTPLGQSLQRIDGRWTGPAAASPGELAAPVSAPVFISEFHYDNAGADSGEFIEVSGPAGTDLAAYSLVLYNGNGGGSYATLPLAGLSIDDEAGGLGAVAVDAPGLQNGSPDGIALVREGAVVEFLSYEGSFTASDGPALSLTATDVLVSEPGDTAPGDSLQLVGGVWTGPSAATRGVLNGLVTGTPFISELHYDNAGADEGEFIEVSGPAGLVLDGYSLVLYNGSNGSAYATEPLTGTIDAERDGQGAVAFAIAGIQNGSPDGLALTAPDGSVLEFLSYEGTFTAADGPAAGLTATDLGVSEDGGTPVGQSLQRLDCVWIGPATASAGALNQSAIAEVAIHDVQGRGPAVAISGPVIVDGVVTALFEDADTLDAFFLQEEDADADADPDTSEAIFVFCRGNCPALTVGNRVRVTGSAEEFFGMSQIDVNELPDGAIEIVDAVGGTVTPAPVRLPAPGSTLAEATFEHLEGMLVRFEDTLVVSEYFQLGRFGQLVLTVEERPQQFTASNAPSVAGYSAFLEDLATRRIILDDRDNDQNDPIVDGDDEPYFYPEGGLSIDNLFRGGERFTGLTGVLHWSFAGAGGTDAWRVRPVPSESYVFEAVNPREALPPPVSGALKVASFNVLNYFTTINDGVATCGPSLLECRGAHSQAELDRQRDKIVAALLAMDADIVGLIEIENDDDTASASLVAALNERLGGPVYAAIETGPIGGDAIKVALIYQTASVEPKGSFAILDATVDPRFVDDRNRPVLAQSFVESATGAGFTVAVNHLKSKGSPCDDLGDPDRSDGQGNCNGVRTSAAIAQAEWLAGDPTGSGDKDVLIIGDLNAYAMEDPITALEAAGYTDLIESFEGPDAYSFVFDGQLGYLDHALANESMLGQVSAVAEWHINADEVPLLDYNDDVQDAAEAFFERESGALPLYAPDPYRASDHDPVIVGLSLAVDGDLDGDRVVDRFDLKLFVRALGAREDSPRYRPDADFDADGRVDLKDLKTFLGFYREALRRRFGDLH